ncbi:PAS domain-containing protein [Kiloniella laminariae]|uniref:PAS domain-containing protein n=1 Tax=Kiloniella laminariae TaxID=454162 RepID=UPI00037BFE10|nr:PAS domain-containing protein [Kiloniella laminariae]
MVEIKDPKNRRFFDYWQSLPRDEGCLVPRKSSFLPEEVPQLLPNMLVFEVISRQEIKIRLQGTAIDEQYGQSMTGGNYLDYVEPHRRDVAASAFWQMAEHPFGIVAELDQALSSGRYVTVEAIGFPLINDTGKNPIIIYQSNEIKKSKREDHDDDGKLKWIYVLSRQIIDIGNGAPVFVD